ncbi:MAG: hypothetical protein HY560_09955, partial [Gemmatimonadetes bacterium]|nr:hypothetical protein [Gemmatimonadota bacterium]
MSRVLSLVAAATFVLASCSDPIDPGTLTVDFVINAGHIHALETNIGFTALVMSGSRVVSSDFESVEVEFTKVGTTTS